ncbi:MAG TPA: pilus assembly protein N-terminal domain-containing protein, partial [Methylocystis sp.]|nr:pilus assembly protein N-terminal domain-containing protein [Methylocystis sp.]
MALALALAVPTLPSSSSAQGRADLSGVETTGNSHSISMGVGKSVVVELPRDATEVVVGNPGVVNAVVRTPRKIYIMGAGQGQTTIFAVDSQGRQFANYEVSVGRDVGELAPLLKAALPRSEIIPRTVNETIILTGSVSSPGEAQKAVDIAKGFAARAGQAAGGAGAGSDANVINALVIRGEDQVMLKVTIAEVSRQVLKQLGFSAQAGGENLLNGAWGALHSENPFAINANLSSTALTINGPSNTSATLKAMERYSVARILAEPSVTAVSGEHAKVVVGGEIAVPSTSSCTIIGTAQSCVP